jgi:translocation protein SEC62
MASNTDAPKFYDDVENLKKLCNFLQTSEGPRVREALLMEKRVTYLKGEKLVNFLAEPKRGTKWPKDLPRFESRRDAINVCKELCNLQFILRCEKQGKGELSMVRNREFDESGYFTWIYEGNKLKSNFMTAALVIGFFCCVCFQIWPTFLKVFVWYLSVTFLLFIFFLIGLRAFIFLCVWIVGYEFWVWPNLFDEQLGFWDSFKPFISCKPTGPGQILYRLGVGAAFFSFCYWAITQPSEWENFQQGQVDFIKDMYEGKFLSDMSQEAKDNIDKPKVQSLEDLLKDLDDAEEEENIQPHLQKDESDEDEDLDAMFDNLMEVEEDIDEDEE